MGERAIIYALSWDVRVTLKTEDTLTQGWGGIDVIRGLSRDVRVTLTSGDTLTQGWRVTLTSEDILMQGRIMSELLKQSGIF